MKKSLMYSLIVLITVFVLPDLAFGDWAGVSQCFIDGKWVTVKGNCPDSGSSGSSGGGSSRRQERYQEEQERINRNNELKRRAKEILRQADATYAAGRYREALDLYRETEKVWSDWGVDQYGNTFDQKIRNCRSMIYVTDAKEAINQADYERAATLIREAQSINGKYGDRWEDLRRECESDALTKKAVESIGQGNYKEAESLLTKAVKVYPKSSWAYYSLGRALNGLERYKEAEVFFLQALQLDPENKHARYNLSVALRNQDRNIEAETALRRLIQACAGLSRCVLPTGSCTGQTGPSK